MTIRLCRDDERDDILSIINAAAEAYRGVIPADRWHEPYMPGDEFDRERAAGVVFWGYTDRGRLAGVMGLQDVRDVSLIRHAYVVPAKQRDGIGGKLLAHLLAMSTKPMLVGTWAAATWAIRFYERLCASVAATQDRAAEILLEHSGTADRNFGRARQSTKRIGLCSARNDDPFSRRERAPSHAKPRKKSSRNDEGRRSAGRRNVLEPHHTIGRCHPTALRARHRSQREPFLSMQNSQNSFVD
ncbi:MAG: GNAT family N-acetyltransferase [Xanthobacteraceae bacterium]